MWLMVAFALMSLLAGCVFLGLCASEATWRSGGTPAILLWIAAAYALALVFLALCVLTVWLPV